MAVGKKEKKMEVKPDVVVEQTPAPQTELTPAKLEPVAPPAEPAKVEKASAPKTAPTEMPVSTETIADVISSLAKSSGSFARSTESLLRAVERLNTVTNRLEAKVVVPDGFATREDIQTAYDAVTTAMRTEISGAIHAAVDSLKNELTVALNALGRSVCEACGREWEDEPSSYFFPGTVATVVLANGDRGKSSDLEKALEELKI